MERILIIGCGGAGKSTLARAVGEKLRIPVVHLDQLFWRPGWVSVSQEEFDRLLALQLEKPAWIMDGNFGRTLKTRLERCDTAIYLDFGRLTCLAGVLKRVCQSYGKVRPDMGECCPERFDWEFLKWVWNFNKEKRGKFYHLLEESKHAHVVVLKNRRQVKHYLETL